MAVDWEGYERDPGLEVYLKVDEQRAGSICRFTLAFAREITHWLRPANFEEYSCNRKPKLIGEFIPRNSERQGQCPAFACFEK
jgi:hypothetical protein